MARLSLLSKTTRDSLRFAWSVLYVVSNARNLELRQDGEYLGTIPGILLPSGPTEATGTRAEGPWYLAIAPRSAYDVVSEPCTRLSIKFASRAGRDPDCLRLLRCSLYVEPSSLSAVPMTYPFPPGALATAVSSGGLPVPLEGGDIQTLVSLMGTTSRATGDGSELLAALLRMTTARVGPPSTPSVPNHLVRNTPQSLVDCGCREEPPPEQQRAGQASVPLVAEAETRLRNYIDRRLEKHRQEISKEVERAVAPVHAKLDAILACLDKSKLP
ncbi:hypothetical protein IWQ60_007442 [Tieghemiomyces parasiticus]|uniref:Uncharacterized protein n=1 Tax=Tieghemiomyces parasiticus TaxID=78921 RepID=A0A9W8A3X0_9FUNG|nr:hypothetical protein IWQ60_007442 [Tieghemiomyces parasiticus]